MRSYLFVLLCLFWLNHVQCIEQLTPYATHWDSTKGLTHNNVYDIEKDDFGRLWLATPGGVSIVDGLGVITLTKTGQTAQGLRFNPVTRIHSHNNQMWVLGLGGIELVDPNSLQVTPFPDPNKHLQRVTNMLFINDSLAYIIANRQLVKLTLPNNKLSLITHTLYRHAQINSFARYDQDHILLMTSAGFVLYNWRKNTHRMFNLENLARTKEDIRALWVDTKNQHIWLSIFNKGIYIYDKQNRLKTQLDVKTATLPSNMVASIQGMGDQVYAVTKRGVVILDRETATPIKHIIPTSNNNKYRQANMALSALLGQHDELFIGTTNGFYSISPLAYEFHSLAQQIEHFNPPILTQFRDENELIILTPTQRISFSERDGWQSIPDKSNSQGVRFFADHSVAVQNFRDILILKGKQKRRYSVIGRPDSSAPITYSSLIEEVNLFVLLDDKYLHLARIQDNTLHVMQSYALELATVINTEYANGILYISSQRHGVMTLAIAHFLQGHTVGLTNLAGAQAVTSLFLDTNKQLWITTLDEGIFTINTNAANSVITPLAISNGRFSASASCITQDTAQRIWISSRHGVSVYQQQTQTIQSYTSANGLGAIPATEHCGQIGQYIYFANQDQLLMVNPAQLTRLDTPLTLTFSNLTVDGLATPLNDNLEIINPSVVEFTMSSTVPHTDSDQLLYRLQGNSTEQAQWLPSRSRYITLIKPKPGQYTMQAKLVGYDGVQKATITAYFQVHPPFYMRPAMIALYAIVVIFIIALGFSFKLRLKNAALALSEMQHQEQRKYAQKLAQEVAAKTELYKEQQQIAVKANLDKTRFIASASHDLRAPLNAIRLKLLNTLSTETSDSEALLSEITLLDQLVDSIVSISKFDSNMIKPVLTNIELCQLIAQSMQRFSDMAQRKSLQLLFTSCDEQAWVHTDPFLLARVINNLIDNAIKNTPENGHIEILLNPDKDSYQLIIKDSGKGISDNIKDKIFNSFVRGTEHYAGSGLGLTIVQQICTILAVSIQLTSSVSGCSFSLKLAKGKINELVETSKKTSQIILIIDDDPVYANEVAAMVSKQELNPKVILNAQTALTYQGPVPALIICDYHLDNGALGSDIAKQLATRFNLVKNNIIIMSEDTRIRDQIKQKLGYRFLNKPIKYSRLSWLIQQIRETQSNE